MPPGHPAMGQHGGMSTEQQPPTGPRYLWVLRHAKAVADPPAGGGDYDRPLTTRGRRDATDLGTRLAAGEGVFGLDGVDLPQVILSSSAARTYQTAELVAGHLGGGLTPDAYRSLYAADTDQVLQIVREVDEQVTSAMYVGHNPTVFRFAWEVLEVDGADRDTLYDHGFATCSVAVVRFDGLAWEDVAAGTGTLCGVFSPPY